MRMESFARGCASLIYRHRRLGKQALALSMRLLPQAPSRRLASLAERLAFWAVPEYQGETLPPIFHYWSARYVQPLLARFGYESPEDFYFRLIREQALAAGGPVSVASFGSGAASLELDLLQRLRAQGLDERFTCIDLNHRLQARALASAARLGLSDRFRFLAADCDRLRDAGRHDVLVVNQLLHHVRDIEGFCALLRRSLAPHGLLATCDIVGRNGHLPWPSVEARVQQAWRTMKPAHRYDRHFGARRATYVPVDHSAVSNEGVRAQVVVAGLSREFEFETFITYGAAVMPFVERRIGFNFDPADAEDRAFIDRIARDDAEAIAGARYPASNMLAVLRHKGGPTRQRHFPVSPQTHMRLTRAELAAGAA